MSTTSAATSVSLSGKVAFCVSHSFRIGLIVGWVVLVTAVMLVCGAVASAEDTGNEIQVLEKAPVSDVEKKFPIRIGGGVYLQSYTMPPKMRQLFEENPEFGMQYWAGITIQGAGDWANLSIGMASNEGPDLFRADVRLAVPQGMAYPLSEWIGQDGVRVDGTEKFLPDGSPDKNGKLDPDEVKWKPWLEIDPVLRQMVTFDGVPYALPSGVCTYEGVFFSRTLLAKAGLDPMQPPRSHEEFIEWCRRVYNHETKTPGVVLQNSAFIMAMCVSSTGSSIIVQDRTSPKTGKVYTFGEQDQDLIAPDTGEDLSYAPVKWRCNVSDEGGIAAMRLYHRLRWEPWILDKETNTPVTVSKDDIQKGCVEVDGRTIRLSAADDVIEGCIFASVDKDIMSRLGRDVAICPFYGNDLTSLEGSGVDPADLGIMPFPPVTPKQKPAMQVINSCIMIGKDVASRGGETPEEKKAYREFIWKFLVQVCGSDNYDEEVRQKVSAGQAQFVNPRDLVRLGFEDYISECQPDFLKLWNDMDDGKIKLMREPFMGRWPLFSAFYMRDAIDIVLRPSGKEFDYVTALKNLDHDANTGVMFEMPQETIDHYRPFARIVAAGVIIGMAFMLFMIIRSFMKKAQSRSGVFKGYLPWVLLFPAVGSIALWNYYPLLQGMVMAFQDYHIGGKTPFVGLDNFIRILLDHNFYHYLFTTMRFVTWSICLSFVTPIVLAILLSEAPWAKTFFRSLFFLPQLTSGLVVTLMWKEMYIGTNQGTINRVLTFLFGWAGFQPVDWLGDPSVVMACVIIPGVWGAAGVASLIYLAALKSVPDELYEAACIDGAGIFSRIRRITLPTIWPLVLINFIGAFIGTFQSMGNIFILTFGGPGKETMVMAMAIWQEAYMSLRFSIATSYAWILGSLLISFTYLQMRVLSKVDFRRASS